MLPPDKKEESSAEKSLCRKDPNKQDSKKGSLSLSINLRICRDADEQLEWRLPPLLILVHLKVHSTVAG